MTLPELVGVTRAITGTFARPTTMDVASLVNVNVIEPFTVTVPIAHKQFDVSP
jgi:hypothetical protein